ncbi:MAG: hypothetical protein QOJ76_2302, partial [Acidobacteriota bacterium]|nr:hypothetical protein [Acidobacteriota bacterium]
ERIEQLGRVCELGDAYRPANV